MLRSFDSLNIQVSEGNGADGGQLVDWLPDPGGALKKPPCGGGVSVEAHPGEELNGSAFLADEPCESLLENTLAGDAVLRENGVKAALRGGSLPATIEQFNEALADLSDQVAMQADLSNLTFKRNRCVGFAPVGTGGDGAVHLGFDLAHLKCV